MMKREKETEEYRATVIILRNNGTHIFIKSLLLRSKKKERKRERERERERRKGPKRKSKRWPPSSNPKKFILVQCQKEPLARTSCRR